MLKSGHTKFSAALAIAKAGGELDNPCMKNLIFLLLLCSCSTVKDLYEDVMTPEKDEPVKTTEVTQEKPQAPRVVPTVTYEDEVSKNWEYQRQIASYVARTTSLDQQSVLMIVRDSTSKFTVGILAKGTLMKYREGHSIEVKIDDQYKNFRVEPTDGDSLRIFDALEFAQALKGKKTLEVNVLNEQGPKKYHFNVSGLQDFFTTI